MDTPACMPPASIITQVNSHGDQVIVSPDHKGKYYIHIGNWNWLLERLRVLEFRVVLLLLASTTT